MSNRKTFGVQVLTDTLESIAEHLQDDMDIYLIGGGAMMFYELKPATKDIDIVFANQEDMEMFIDASSKAGIKLAENPGEEYENMGASVIMVAPSGIQLDLFDRVVCNALELTDSVVGRATHQRDMGKLHIHLMSREDIALFKSITEREADLDDIRTLTEAGLDWSIVEEECLNQKDSGYWADLVLGKMVDLKEKYGIDIRLRKIKEHADSYILRKTFKMFMKDGEIKFKDLHKIVSEKTGYLESWTRKSLRKLEKEGFIKSRKSGRNKIYSLKNN
jgi:hypothetical protein